MRLKRLRSDWEDLGSKDAYWAVLTDEARRGGRWDVEEFYATGREEIAQLVGQLSELWPDLRRGDVLDFGCGPGRLTHALAARFQRAVGVDVSAPMIALARERDSAVGNCEFVHNVKADLSVFPDASFDFVYSHLVLQHIPTELARGYIKEFVRVLRQDGFALFQVHVPQTGRLMRLRSELAYLRHARRDYRAKVRLFGVPREDVETDVEAAGGRLVHVAPDYSVGSESWWYGVARR